MNTTSYGMSSSLVTALESRHCGRSLATTAFNQVKNVSITEMDELINLRFSVDKKYLRNSAIGWDQFREDTEGLAMLKSFSFFVKMIFELQQSESGDLEGQNVAVFLEWVRHADIPDKHVGIRLHVFSNRKGSKAKPSNILQEMIKQNKKIVESNKRQKKTLKQEEHVFHYESYQHIVSMSEYARQVADVYNHNYEASSAMDDASIHQTSHKAHPEYVFGLERDGFKIDKAVDLQNQPGNYRSDTGAFIFPDETRIYRMMPSDLNLDKFFHRYLPDYFFTRVKMPDIRIHLNQETGIMRAYITPHLDRDRYLKHFNRWGERIGTTDEWDFPWGVKNDLINLVKEHFNVWDQNDTPTEVSAVNTLQWLQVTPLMHDMVFHNSTMTTDGAKVISPLIKTLLTNKHSLSDIDVLKIRMEYFSEWVKDRRGLQKKMVDMFVERVFDDEYADVSEPGRMILLWKSHMRKPRVCNFRKIDSRYSVFANRAIRIMEMYDKVLHVSSTHKALFLLNHAKYNAYNQKLGLHFNSIFTGEGATSKSFLFDTVSELSIEGTTETITYHTLRADAIDGDQIDTIQQYHEAPPGMIMKNKHQDGTQEAMFKNKMTEQVIKVKEFWRDENTGERKNRIAKSQCIGVVMANSNDDPSDISEAMATRFFKGEFEKTENGRSIQECQRGVRNSLTCPSAMRLKAFWVEYCKEEQMRMWTVYKFIYMGILAKPNLVAADIVYSQMTTYLKRNHKISIPPRTKERFEILCSVYTILNGLEHVFNIEGGVHACQYERQKKYARVPKQSASGEVMYEQEPVLDVDGAVVFDENGCQIFRNGKILYEEIEDGYMDVAVPKPFHPIQLLDIEPWLVCTEEIAIFSLTQIGEEIVNPNEYKVIKALWKIHSETKKYKEDLIETNEGKRTTEKDYSYIRLNSGNRLLVEIINAIPASAGKMSKHNVQSILKLFNERCVQSPDFKYPDKDDPPRFKVFNDGYPEPIDEQNVRIMLTMEQGFTHIHMDLFKCVRNNGGYVNKIRESIRSLFHKNRMENQLYLLGSQKRVNGIINCPSLFDTIEMRVNDNTIAMKNPIHLSELTQQMYNIDPMTIDEKQRYSMDRVEMDLTCMAGLLHSADIGMTQEAYADHYIESLQTYPTNQKEMKYPDDLLKRNTTRESDDTSTYHSKKFTVDMKELKRRFARKRKRS